MPNNNTYISAAEPVIEGDQNRGVFSRAWFRFLSTVSRKVAMLDGTLSTGATAGTADPLPALPAGYMTIIDLDGVERKVPYYNA